MLFQLTCDRFRVTGVERGMKTQWYLFKDHVYRISQSSVTMCVANIMPALYKQYAHEKYRDAYTENGANGANGANGEENGEGEDEDEDEDAVERRVSWLLVT